MVIALGKWPAVLGSKFSSTCTMRRRSTIIVKRSGSMSILDVVPATSAGEGLLARSPKTTAAGRRTGFPPQRRLPEHPLLNLSMSSSSAYPLLTVCTTNNTFDTLASVVTRGNEVSQWFLNVPPPVRPTSEVLINIFGGGSRLRPHLKERQSVRSSMRFSPATSARQSLLERYGCGGEYDHMKRLLSNLHPSLGCWQ